jgi:hypothetical protein
MRRHAWVLVVFALVAVPAVALAATSAKQVRVTNCTKVQYKPKLIIVSCGDASNYVAKLKWSSWTKVRATGSGVDEVNSCEPNCASGHEIGTAAKVALSDPKRCKGQEHRVFDRMKLSFVGEQGPHSTQTVVLGCPIK